MKRFSFNRLITLVVLCLCFNIVSCKKNTEDSDKYTYFKVGYSLYYGANPFVVAMVNGARNCIEDWKAKDVIVELIIAKGSNADPTQQIIDCEDIFARKVDGLLIFPGAGSEIMSDPVRNLFNKNDIPVVVTDIGLSNAEWISYITSDNYLGGSDLARLLRDHLPAGSKVITFDSSPSTENCIIRKQGFEETAKALGFVVLPEIILNKNLEDGRRMMEDVLVAYPDLDAIFHINQLTAQGSVSIPTSSKDNHPFHVAFDLDENSLRMVREGKILGLMAQDPYKIGYEGMNQLLIYLSGGTPEKNITIPPKLCVLETAELFANDPQVVQ